MEPIARLVMSDEPATAVRSSPRRLGVGNRKTWLGILFGVFVVGGVVLGALAGPDVTCSCTKVSDTSLEVTVESELVFYRFYEYYFSDGHLTDKVYEQYTAEHTFTNISVSSFPLTVWVYLYLDEYSYDYDTYTEQSIDCAHLFAPEIDVVANGDAIADGETHDVGCLPPGRAQLTYTIDNADGAGTLTVDGVAAAQLANCDAFAVDTALPLVVSAGASATLRVSITLEDPGAFGLDLRISNDDSDEDPYSIQVEGSVQTPEQVALGGASQQLVPLGASGGGAILDQEPALDEAGAPVMAGFLPLSGEYEVGELVSGAAMVCDPAMNPLRSAWIHAYVYAVDIGARPESRSLLDHWMIRFDSVTGCYALEWNTEGMKPGIYDIYLSLGSRGAGKTLRIQLVEPEV